MTKTRHHVSNHPRNQLCIYLKQLDLRAFFGYHLSVQVQVYPVNQIQPISIEEKLIMKLAIRIFALSVVVAGAAAASVSSATTHAVPSRQAASASLPVPMCGPNLPTCPPPTGSGNTR